MKEVRINNRLSLAAVFCLIGCTTLTSLALTIVPAGSVNACLLGAVVLGLLSAGLSSGAVSRKI